MEKRFILTMILFFLFSATVEAREITISFYKDDASLLKKEISEVKKGEEIKIFIPKGVSLFHVEIGEYRQVFSTTEIKEEIIVPIKFHGTLFLEKKCLKFLPK